MRLANITNLPIRWANQRFGAQVRIEPQTAAEQRCCRLAIPPQCITLPSHLAVAKTGLRD
jgi:hypothetical protein